MPNGINELSPEIRDFLLNRNLILSDTVTENGLTSLGVGLGSQANITELSDSVLPSINLETSAIDFRNATISRNRYTSIADMVSATLINNSYSYNQVDGGYINENNQLNIGGPSTNALDVITSITSQEGFGLGSNGFSPQNNVNTSITGRVLGGLGVINDTPLGIIGGEQLLLALAQKASFNAQKEIIGKINLQPFSLLRGASFVNPDYSITVGSTTGGRVLDKVLDIAGFELPISGLDTDASIFYEKTLGMLTDTLDKVDYVELNNTIIRNTGKGQILRLFDNLNTNIYKPAYESDRDDDRLAINDPIVYGVSNDILLSEVSTTPKVGSIPTFDEVAFDGSSNIWQPNVKMDDGNKSLLYKTKLLFGDRVFYSTILDLQGTPKTDFTQLATSSGGRYSKGSGVLSKDYLLADNKENVDNVFCRTWNITKKYDNLTSLQKNTGLLPNKNRIRNNIEGSVLDDNGFVKVSPYNLPSSEGDTKDDVKKYMFSIENLAWGEFQNKLPEYEKGPGDKETNTKGRIMWFPPYEMSFQETTSVNWDKTDFIGRGEPIYTYNNTERSGQLTFKIIIDHPEYLNDKNLMKNDKFSSDEVLSSIAAGCSNYSDYFSVDEIAEIEGNVPAGQTVFANSIDKPNDLNFYFPNDVSTITKYPDYELSGGILTNPTFPDAGYNSTLPSTGYTNSTNTGLNDDWNDTEAIQKIKDFIASNDSYEIKIYGYASLPGTSSNNLKLSVDRIASVKSWLFENIGDDLNTVTTKPIGSGDSLANGVVDSLDIKKERKVKLEFNPKPTSDKSLIESVEIKKERNTQNKELVPKLKKRFHNESEYFEKLSKSDAPSDKIIFNKLKNKIKHFQPSFHSTTPEGFNSRLTFLQQCTRQGPTVADGKANNLAFGMPPVCILRIGDFYNTKIVIDSLGLTFDPLVWDLNPEGVGVQPMIATATLSFKFIGGSSLNGPINKLQNAVSFNYFANTEIYDPRADKLVPSKKDGDTGLVLSDLKDYFLNGENDPSSKLNNIPLNNEQISNSEFENSGIVPEPTSEVITDSTILEKINWEVTYSSINNQFMLSYTSGAGFDLSGLNSAYNIKLLVLDVELANMIFSTVISEGNALTSETNSGDFLTSKDGGFSEGLYLKAETQFKLIISGGNISPITTYINLTI